MTVKIIKAEKYDVSALEGLIKDAIKDLKLNLKNKKTAVLKPNIVIPAKPGSAIITHPAITEAVINVLEDYGFEDIIIGEGPGVGADEIKAFELSGYSKLAASPARWLLSLLFSVICANSSCPLNLSARYVSPFDDESR